MARRTEKRGHITKVSANEFHADTLTGEVKTFATYDNAKQYLNDSGCNWVTCATLLANGKLTTGIHLQPKAK